MKVLFFVPYPEGQASSQHRVYQYQQILKENGIQCTILPFYSESLFQILYKKGYILKKLIGILSAICRRIIQIFQACKYDLVFIHRELHPFATTFLEQLLLKLNENLIFDFDDAIYKPLPHIKRWQSRLKDPKKTDFLIQKAKLNIVGNKYLAEYVKNFHTQAIILPTPVDLHRYSPEKYAIRPNKTVLTIGWIGTVDNLPYLEMVAPILKDLSKVYPFELRIISSHPYDINGVNVVNIKWEDKSEPKILSELDIGLYPLPDTEWNRAKCGYKALLYLAMGIPQVCSPVGILREIIKHNYNGLFAETADDWKRMIELLILDKDKRAEISANARSSFPLEFSLEQCGKKLVDILQSFKNRI